MATFLQEWFQAVYPMLLEFTWLLMPETSDLQRWYAGQTRSGFESYLAEFTREYEVPLIDTRSGTADTEFADGHHLPQPSALAFTRRLLRVAQFVQLFKQVPR
jgi:hypothetical protein